MPNSPLKKPGNNTKTQNSKGNPETMEALFEGLTEHEKGGFNQWFSGAEDQELIEFAAHLKEQGILRNDLTDQQAQQAGDKEEFLSILQKNYNPSDVQQLRNALTIFYASHNQVNSSRLILVRVDEERRGVDSDESSLVSESRSPSDSGGSIARSSSLDSTNFTGSELPSSDSGDDHVIQGLGSEEGGGRTSPDSSNSQVAQGLYQRLVEDQQNQELISSLGKEFAGIDNTKRAVFNQNLLTALREKAGVEVEPEVIQEGFSAFRTTDSGKSYLKAANLKDFCEAVGSVLEDDALQKVTADDFLEILQGTLGEHKAKPTSYREAVPLGGGNKSNLREHKANPTSSQETVSFSTRIPTEPGGILFNLATEKLESQAAQEEGEAAREEAAREEAVQAERVEAERVEATREEAAQAARAREEAVREEAAQAAQAAREQAAREEAAQAAREQAAQAARAREEAVREEAAQAAQAAREQAAREEAAQAAREQAAQAARAREEAVQAERVEAERVEATREEAAQAAREEAAQAAREQAAREKKEREAVTSGLQGYKISSAELERITATVAGSLQEIHTNWREGLVVLTHSAVREALNEEMEFLVKQMKDFKAELEKARTLEIKKEKAEINEQSQTERAKLEERLRKEMKEMEDELREERKSEFKEMEFKYSSTVNQVTTLQETIKSLQQQIKTHYEEMSRFEDSFQQRFSQMENHRAAYGDNPEIRDYHYYEEDGKGSQQRQPQQPQQPQPQQPQYPPQQPHSAWPQQSYRPPQYPHQTLPPYAHAHPPQQAYYQPQPPYPYPQPYHLPPQQAYYQPQPPYPHPNHQTPPIAINIGDIGSNNRVGVGGGSSPEPYADEIDKRRGRPKRKDGAPRDFAGDGSGEGSPSSPINNFSTTAAGRNDGPGRNSKGVPSRSGGLDLDDGTLRQKKIIGFKRENGNCDNVIVLDGRTITKTFLPSDFVVAPGRNQYQDIELDSISRHFKMPHYTTQDQVFEVEDSVYDERVLSEQGDSVSSGKVKVDEGRGPEVDLIHGSWSFRDENPRFITVIVDKEGQKIDDAYVAIEGIPDADTSDPDPSKHQLKFKLRYNPVTKEVENHGMVLVPCDRNSPVIEDRGMIDGILSRNPDYKDTINRASRDTDIEVISFGRDMSVNRKHGKIGDLELPSKSKRQEHRERKDSLSSNSSNSSTRPRQDTGRRGDETDVRDNSSQIDDTKGSDLRLRRDGFYRSSSDRGDSLNLEEFRRGADRDFPPEDPRGRVLTTERRGRHSSLASPTTGPSRGELPRRARERSEGDHVKWERDTAFTPYPDTGKAPPRKTPSPVTRRIFAGRDSGANGQLLGESGTNQRSS